MSFYNKNDADLGSVIMPTRIELDQINNDNIHNIRSRGLGILKLRACDKRPLSKINIPAAIVVKSGIRSRLFSFPKAGEDEYNSIGHVAKAIIDMDTLNENFPHILEGEKPNFNIGVVTGKVAGCIGEGDYRNM